MTASGKGDVRYSRVPSPGSRGDEGIALLKRAFQLWSSSLASSESQPSRRQPHNVLFCLAPLRILHNTGDGETQVL